MHTQAIYQRNWPKSIYNNDVLLRKLRRLFIPLEWQQYGRILGQIRLGAGQTQPYLRCTYGCRHRRRPRVFVSASHGTRMGHSLVRDSCHVAQFRFRY